MSDLGKGGTGAKPSDAAAVSSGSAARRNTTDLPSAAKPLRWRLNEMQGLDYGAASPAAAKHKHVWIRTLPGVHRVFCEICGVDKPVKR